MWRTDAHWIFYWLLCKYLSAHWSFVGRRTALSVTFGDNVNAFLRALRALLNKYLLERKICETKIIERSFFFLSKIRFICNIHSVSNRRFGSNKHFVSNTRFIYNVLFMFDVHFVQDTFGAQHVFCPTYILCPAHSFHQYYEFQGNKRKLLIRDHATQPLNYLW